MEKVKITDLCLNSFWIMPQTPKYVDNGVPYITSKNIKNGSINFDKINFITDKDYNKISKNREIKINDFLISMIGTIGEVAIIKKSDLYFYGQNMYLLRFDEKKVNFKYMYYFLTSPNTRNILISNKNSSTQGYIKYKTITNLDVNIYDLPTQEKIVRELDKINEIIDKKKQQLADLDTLIKSQFTEMFGNKYSTKPLNNVCEELFAGGDVNKDKYSKTKTKEFQIPIFTNGEKDNGLYGFTDKARVFKKAVTISGRGTIGFTCLRENPFYPAVRLLVAVPNEKIITATYLKYFIKNKNYAGQGVSIPQLTIPMIKNERIPLPPIELQNKFAEFVKHIEIIKSQLKDNIQELETLLASRMQHYFGEN